VHGVIAIHFAGSFGGEAACQAIEVGPGDGGAGATPVTLARPAEAGNLLANPGFEEGVIGAVGRMGETVAGTGWRYLFASPTQCYVWAESGYDIHPDWGLPVFRTGDQALRTHGESDCHTIVYQDVFVSPRTTYRASAFAQGVDLRGAGFGTHPGDGAALRVQELGPCGKVIAEHDTASISEAGDYRELVVGFTTGDKADRVRFVLDTNIVAPYNEGHVTYDDCTLVRVSRTDGD
jgi:hypothetical protein